MASFGNLSLMRCLLALGGSPLLGGFVWGACNPPAGWDTLAGRLIHGALSAPMALIMAVVRPDKVPSWPAVGVAFLVLLWVAIRFPRAQQCRD